MLSNCDAGEDSLFFFWRRLLRVPWTTRRSNQFILKEINPEYSLEGLVLKLKLQYFGQLVWRADSLEKTDFGKDWRQEEKGTTEHEMVGWHHRLDGREFEQALGDSEGQDSPLTCCSPWGCKEQDRTEWLTASQCQVFVHMEHTLHEPRHLHWSLRSRCHQGPKRKEVAGWVWGIMESRATGGQSLTELQRMHFKGRANMRWVPLEPGGKVQPRIRERKTLLIHLQGRLESGRENLEGTRMTLLVARDRKLPWASSTGRHSIVCHGMSRFTWSKGIDSTSVCCKPEGS